MDRQRNDRLGRTGRFRQQFKHRRQILRTICFANAYSDCNSNRNSLANSYSYSYGHGYIYTNADPQWLLCSQYLPNVWQRCYG